VKFDLVKASEWLKSLETSLPGVGAVLNMSKSPVLILGAGALELYSEMG
jgi:hypothetical protein